MRKTRALAHSRQLSASQEERPRQELTPPALGLGLPASRTEGEIPVKPASLWGFVMQPEWSRTGSSWRKCPTKTERINHESRKACVQKSGEGGGNSRHDPVKVSGDGDEQEDAEPAGVAPSGAGTVRAKSGCTGSPTEKLAGGKSLRCSKKIKNGRILSSRNNTELYK